MKKLLVIIAAITLGCGAAAAQNFMVVDTEKIFKSINEYNKAIENIDALGEKYQKQIDDEYAAVETLYNSYQSEKPYLSATVRQQREDAIINREKEIMKKQEDFFGQQGELMKKRIELIKPIQDKVFSAINNYADRNGYSVVLDISGNPTILYYTAGADKTDDIIRIVK